MQFILSNMSNFTAQINEEDIFYYLEMKHSVKGIEIKYSKSVCLCAKLPL